MQLQQLLWKVNVLVSIDVRSLSAPLTINSNHQVDFFILSLTHNSWSQLKEFLKSQEIHVIGGVNSLGDAIDCMGNGKTSS